MAFSGPQLVLNAPFKEIYGIGPFKVEDAEGRVLLQMDMVKTGSKGGYQAPLILGINDETGEYSTAANITATGTMNNALLLDAENADKLYDLFDENEYRIYMPNKKDLYYRGEDIATLILPKYYKQPATGNITGGKDIVLDIETLIKLIVADSTYAVPADKTEAVDKLKSDGVLLNVKRCISDQLLDCIVTLVELLTHKYGNVGIELYKDDTIIVAKN